MSVKQMNIRSVLVAASENSCTDGAAIAKVISTMHNDGYKGVSDKWVENCNEWSTFKPNAMKTIIDQAIQGIKWRGDVKPLPKKYLDMLSGGTVETEKTVEVTVNPSSTETKHKMNLRTLLENCYQNQIYEPKVALDILKSLKDSGKYEVSDRDITFSSGWATWKEATFHKMVENTHNGANGFAKNELFDCPDFTKYMPVTSIKANGQQLNERTILNKFYEKNCNDGVKIAAAILDAKQAGFTGINDEIGLDTLISASETGVRALTTAAHDGGGVFSGSEILSDCPEF